MFWYYTVYTECSDIIQYIQDVLILYSIYRLFWYTVYTGCSDIIQYIQDVLILYSIYRMFWYYTCLVREATREAQLSVCSRPVALLILISPDNILTWKLMTVRRSGWHMVTVSDFKLRHVACFTKTYGNDVRTSYVRGSRKMATSDC